MPKKNIFTKLQEIINMHVPKPITAPHLTLQIKIINWPITDSTLVNLQV